MATMPALPLFAINKLRSLGFIAEGSVLFGVAGSLFPEVFANLRDFKPDELARARKSLDNLLRKDAENIAAGLYPPTVLMPESIGGHLGRLPKLVWDSFRAQRRRRSGKTTTFSKTARPLADEVPRYYRRNFHFQTDGYLSDISAELYEHQVEILFGGGADPMRRLILEPLRERFGGSDGQGLHFLEVACGTGRATRFVQMAFPKARITALDLSAPYIAKAQERLVRNSQDVQRLTLMTGDATALPFKDGTFDAAYSIFLFHELPYEQREQVLRESIRVLKSDGLLALVDSLQKGDEPELDLFLERFPNQYHEPFFRNYIERPLEPMLDALGLKRQATRTGFFSKCCAAEKIPT